MISHKKASFEYLLNMIQKPYNTPYSSSLLFRGVTGFKNSFLNEFEDAFFFLYSCENLRKDFFQFIFFVITGLDFKIFPYQLTIYLFGLFSVFGKPAGLILFKISDLEHHLLYLIDLLAKDHDIFFFIRSIAVQIHVKFSSQKILILIGPKFFYFFIDIF